MKAFILAAGKGERMRPLTDHLPKPLLDVDGKTLLDHQIDKLISAGIQEIIINTSYLGHMIHEHLSHRRSDEVTLYFSDENEPLETGGAIYNALDLLGQDPFMLINGDVWTDLDYAALLSDWSSGRNGDCDDNYKGSQGHLVLVETPDFKKQGDFSIDNGMLKPLSNIQTNYTFSGVSVLSPLLISRYPMCRPIFALKEVFDWGIENNYLSAQLYKGFWLDVGTPERFNFLKKCLS